MVRIIIAGFLILGIAMPAHAGRDEAIAAYQRGDHETAFREFQALAEQGDPDAQNNLGILYERGHGTTRDLAAAATWYRRAAEQGHVSAQFNLGYMLVEGRGVPQDPSDAAAWYRKAADQGHAKAQNNLGYMFLQGQGVAQNDAEAAAWFKKAAALGQPNAMSNLGFMYMEGRGVELDRAQALVWLTLAATYADGRLEERAEQRREQLLEQTTAGDVKAARSLLIAKVQESLSALGFEPGPVDGILGSRTLDSISAFKSKLAGADRRSAEETLLMTMVDAMALIQ